MAQSDTDLLLNLLLFATTQNPQNPTAILTAMVGSVGAGYGTGGSRMISGSVQGKAFSFQPDPNLTADKIMTGLRGALGYINTYSADEINRLLYRPASSYGRVGFVGHHYHPWPPLP